MQLLHLGFGRPLGCFPVDLASRTCLTSLSWAFWIHGRTNVVLISEFGEVVLHSGFCEFHSCALCCEVSHQGRHEGEQCPGRRITGGAPKSRKMSQVFSSIQHIYSQKTLGSNMGAPKLFLSRAASNVGTPTSHRELFANIPSLALAPELIFFRPLSKIQDRR